MEATAKSPGMGRTSIQVSDRLADELHSRKERGDSYEDVIWSLIDQADGADQGQQPRQDTPPSEPEPTAAEHPDTGETGVEATLATVEFPTGKQREECVDAVRAAYEYLRENGSASMRDFVREVMPDHPVGYDVPELEPGERYRGAWWRKVVKPGLEALPDVESPPSGGSDWTHVEAHDA